MTTAEIIRTTDPVTEAVRRAAAGGSVLVVTENGTTARTASAAIREAASFWAVPPKAYRSYPPGSEMGIGEGRVYIRTARGEGRGLNVDAIILTTSLTPQQRAAVMPCLAAAEEPAVVVSVCLSVGEW